VDDEVLAATSIMAAVIGLIAAVLVIGATWFVERRLKVDDPVGAIAVHGVHASRDFH
jgi:ammonium transporter, Amt family